MKSSKFVLDTSAMQEGFFVDSAMIGVASSLPGHRFAWMLNARFALDFRRAADMDVCLNAKSKEDFQHFAVFHFVDEVCGIQHFLYRLRAEKKVLLPEVKNLDYLWLIQNARSEDETENYVKHLRAMPEVQMATTLLPDELKSRAHLLV